MGGGESPGGERLTFTTRVSTEDGVFENLSCQQAHPSAEFGCSFSSLLSFRLCWVSLAAPAFLRLRRARPALYRCAASPVAAFCAAEQGLQGADLKQLWLLALQHRLSS